ncbi:MAG: ABC transporter permease [Limnochordaceae bacterium]|nr:ABC transporter permease [Limnochordaceae bacterium]
MTWVRLGWKNVWARPVQAMLTAAVVALAVALGVSVYLVADASRRAMQQAALPFDVVVGDRGSAMQLAFNAVFLQDVPIGNVPYELYARLREDPRVAWALPLALGDNYRGFRVVGTTAEAFERLRRDGTPDGPPLLSVREGRTFGAPFEAVVGADVARALGIRVGDTFQAAHGVTAAIEPEVHADVYHVVGVLAPSGHPYDRGIFVDIRSVWEVHHEHGAGEEGEAGHGAPGAPAAEPPASAASASEPPGDVTIVLVRPTNLMAAYQIYQELNSGDVAQAVFPGQVLGQIFQLLGTGQEVLSGVALSTIVMAGITVLLSLSWATLARERDVAVLRAVGAHRLAILAVTLVESLVITLLGAAAGVGAGYGVAALLARSVRAQTAIAASLGWHPGAGWMALAAVGIGLLASLWPALATYRRSAGEVLARAMGN